MTPTEKININAYPGICTFPARSSNQITEDYYWFLVGEINRGTIKKAVCRKELQPFGTVSYYLISER